MKGYIPISRGLFEHPFWCEKRCYSRFEAWIFLIKDARFEDTKLYLSNKVFVIKRGQISISLRYLGESLGWSTKKVKHFLQLLVDDKMISVETPKETGQTLITIINYALYNDFQSFKETVKETAGKQQGNSRETNINKDNKDNKREIASFSSNEYSKSKLLKEKKEKNSAKKEKAEYDLSFVDNEWLPLFSEWIDYKNSREEYYENIGLSKTYLHLLKLSNNNLTTAKLIVDKSIMQSWKGLFPVEKNNLEIKIDDDTDRLRNSTFAKANADFSNEKSTI